MEIFISKVEDVGLQLIHKGPLWQVFSNESFQKDNSLRTTLFHFG